MALDPKRRDLLLRMATRLGKVTAGSREADTAIHAAPRPAGRGAAVYNR